MASQSSIASPTLTVDDLADNVLSDILSFLDVKDKCRAAQVCRRWNSLVHQKSLWKHIDLTHLKVDLRSIWKLVRAYYTDMLLSLRLHGFIESIKSTECISNAVLTDIKTRCPNLRELYITKANLVKIDSSLLPSSLRRLTIKRCLISVDWFKVAAEAGTLQSLEELSLEGSTRTADATLKDVATFKEVKCLKLDGCYRIDERGIAAICQNLIKIEKLYLDDSDASNQILHHVGSHLKELKVINLINCTRLTDTGIGSLSVLKKLTCVDLRLCNVTQQGVINFLAVTPSKYLECLKLSSNIGFTQEDVVSQQALKPNLKIELDTQLKN